MPHSLDYGTRPLPWWEQPRTRRQRTVATAFVIPPATLCLAGLLTRIALHYGLWGALPLFLLAAFACVIASLALAGWFAVGHAGGRAVFRIVAWVVCSGACVVAGLALVDLLPISVGDGP